MGLCDLAPEEIKEIEARGDGPEAEGPVAAGTQGQDGENEALAKGKKKRVREKMTSPFWKWFKKGPPREDGFYDAICIFCGAKFKMGNGKGTGSMKNHFEKACTKVPKGKRQKTDALQKYLQASTDEGI